MVETAPWKMTEDGEWELQEPYASKVWELRVAATKAFNDVLCDELSKCSPYTYEQLHAEYLRRCNEREQEATDKVASFIIEAMSGQLFT